MLIKRENRAIVKCDPPVLIIAVSKGKKILGKMDCVIKEEINGITISDITCSKNNKGFGSLMMNTLVEFAKDGQYDYIDGWLSKIDLDHKDRLLHFYRKFGFEIMSNDSEMKFADIKLTL